MKLPPGTVAIMSIMFAFVLSSRGGASPAPEPISPLFCLAEANH